MKKQSPNSDYNIIVREENVGELTILVEDQIYAVITGDLSLDEVNLIKVSEYVSRNFESWDNGVLIFDKFEFMIDGSTCTEKS